MCSLSLSLPSDSPSPPTPAPQVGLMAELLSEILQRDFGLKLHASLYRLPQSPRARIGEGEDGRPTSMVRPVPVCEGHADHFYFDTLVIMIVVLALI